MTLHVARSFVRLDIAAAMKLASSIGIALALVSVDAHRSGVSRRSAVGLAAAGAAAPYACPAVAVQQQQRLITPATGVIAGGKLPLTIGQGTCLVRPGQAQNTVSLGVDCGYRLFDTAQRYGNEEGLGKALREAIKAKKVMRDELFVTTKVWVDNMGLSLIHI